jgi:hypothetical protein
LFQQIPETIMFWVYPLNSTDDSSSSEELIIWKDSQEVSHTEPLLSSAVLFNTGDFSDAGCNCNRRLVIVYRSDAESIEVQLWKEASGKYVELLCFVSLTVCSLTITLAGSVIKP